MASRISLNSDSDGRGHLDELVQSAGIALGSDFDLLAAVFALFAQLSDLTEQRVQPRRRIGNGCSRLENIETRIVVSLGFMARLSKPRWKNAY